MLLSWSLQNVLGFVDAKPKFYERIALTKEFVIVLKFISTPYRPN
jgi:hypothetical protein